MSSLEVWHIEHPGQDDDLLQIRDLARDAGDAERIAGLELCGPNRWRPRWTQLTW